MREEKVVKVGREVAVWGEKIGEELGERRGIKGEKEGREKWRGSEKRKDKRKGSGIETDPSNGNRGLFVCDKNCKQYAITRVVHIARIVKGMYCYLLG